MQLGHTNSTKHDHTKQKQSKEIDEPKQMKSKEVKSRAERRDCKICIACEPKKPPTREWLKQNQRFHFSRFQSLQELDFQEEELSDHRRESQLEDQPLEVLSQEGDDVLAPIG